MNARTWIASSAILFCAAAPAPAQCIANDLTAYFVPNYPGWDTAKRVWIGSDPGTTYGRWFSYGTNKYENIKFNNPHSAETYTFDGSWIYITAENNQNNSSISRVWPPGGNGFLGLNWLPRYGYTCVGCRPREAVDCYTQNQFDTCYFSENLYNNCQFTQSLPTHCGLNGSIVEFANYPYGYSIGTLPSIIKRDTLDDLEVEQYFYGLGRGLLRYERYDSRGNLVNWGQQTSEIPNSPIPDAACFHP
jgi:hypothetical protein